jgi:signal peptidase I
VHVRQVIPRDAIPSVDAPTVGGRYHGDPGDRVVAVDADPPRAYPVRYLDYHEVVNDRVTVDGVERAVAVTWCPICGSAVVYDRTVGGQTLEFGVSGKLAVDGDAGQSVSSPTGTASK